MTRFYSQLPRFSAFEQVVDPDVFAAVPAESVVGVADIVGSTRAIAQGRYKAVNMAGAALISGMMNALGHREFAFVFGGDGASFVVDHRDAEVAGDVMARTARWVADDLALDMRVALVPVEAVRAAGHDVRVARYAVSQNASYAMFSGGGIAWAEARMKEGRFALPLASPGERPDLDGLSCRWKPLQSRHGVMLSLLVQRAGEPPAFRRLVLDLLAAIAEGEARQGHPLAETGPVYHWPPAGIDIEARATRGGQPLALRRAGLWVTSVLSLLLFRTGWSVGGFEPARYLRHTALNTDFRKFDDGLRMTVDCKVETADRLQRLLDEAEAAGIANFGMFRQADALMTCIVPSAAADDHLHFVDGAGGGYAMAAARLKAKLAAAQRA